MKKTKKKATILPEINNTKNLSVDVCEKGFYLNRNIEDFATKTPIITPNSDLIREHTANLTVIGKENTGDIVFQFFSNNEIRFRLKDGKLDIEVKGDLTENAILFIDKINSMIKGRLF